MQVFVARQPIFTADRGVYGYELLFRSSLETVFGAEEQDPASLQGAENASVWLGLETLTDGKKAFINFDRPSLVRGFARLLPSTEVVVEIAEGVEPDDEVIEVCRDLKAAGYSLALDNFRPADSRYPLLPMADVVKADFPQIRGEETRAIPQLADPHFSLLAEKVEMDDEFRLAREAGYTYFQGFFFSRPSIIRGYKAEGVGVNHLRILEEVHRPSIDFDRLEWLIKAEVALVYKILRLLNSAWIGLRCRIESVRQALVMLGEEGVRQWVCLMVLADLSIGKPTELVRTSAARGFFCEMVGADRCRGREHELFMVGLFSVMDAILEKPMEEALRGLSLSDVVVQTLLGHDTPYRPIYELALAYERADWDAVDRCAASVGINGADVAYTYIRAVERADWALR